MKLSLDTDRRFILYKLVGTHKCRVLFFIAVELDGTAVVAHFGKREANHFLLFLRNGASLLLHLVVDFRAEARHYFVSGTAQVSRPHAVVDARYAPRKAFLAFLLIVRTWLCTRYHGRVHHRIGFIPIPCQHLVDSVAQAFARFSQCVPAQCVKSESNWLYSSWVIRLFYV